MTRPSPERRRLLAAALFGLAAAPLAAQAPDRADAPAPERDRRSRDWFTDTLLTDQDGQRQRFYSDLLAPPQPRVTLLHSVFTSCSSACPLIVQRLLQLQGTLSGDMLREVVILSLSIDPLNDSPGRLKAFALKHGADGPRWRFLTGAPIEVERVARRLGLWPAEPEAHQTTLIAGRASAGHWVKLRPDAPVPDLARQLQRFWPRPSG